MRTNIIAPQKTVFGKCSVRISLQEPIERLTQSNIVLVGDTEGVSYRIFGTGAGWVLQFRLPIDATGRFSVSLVGWVSVPREQIDENGEAVLINEQVAARSKSGLYHAQLCRKRDTYILGYDDTLTGQSDIIQIDASRGRLQNGDNVWFQIMDVHGNYYFHHVQNITLPEPVKTDKPNKNPDIVQVPEPEIKVDEPVDCPDCEPEIIDENEPIERDLNVPIQRLLTTQWAVLKTR